MGQRDDRVSLTQKRVVGFADSFDGSAMSMTTVPPSASLSGRMNYGPHPRLATSISGNDRAEVRSGSPTASHQTTRIWWRHRRRGPESRPGLKGALRRPGGADSRWPVGRRPDERAEGLAGSDGGGSGPREASFRRVRTSPVPYRTQGLVARWECESTLAPDQFG
jgi:hypothetical protein